MKILRTLIIAAMAASFSCHAACPFGKVLNVAVYEAGPFFEYQKVFLQTVRALQEDGYMPKTKLDGDFVFDEGDNYQKFARASQGGCFEFLEDGLYNGHWDPGLIDEEADRLKARIKDQQDVDLIFAMGSRAGSLFADPSLGPAVMVMVPTDPVRAGFIGPGEFSDKPNVHVQKQINRIQNELSLFHRIFSFKKLGIMVDDNKVNWAMQGVSVIEDVARAMDFEVVRCQGPLFDSDAKVAREAYSKCIDKLSNECDAVYLTYTTGASPHDMYSQLLPLYEKQIPSFSQAGGSEVSSGVLLSLSDNDFKELGAFEAKVAEAISRGQKPHEISQYFNAPLTLNLNLEAAMLIDWKPDFEILVAIDNVYRTIRRPAHPLSNAGEALQQEAGGDRAD